MSKRDYYEIVGLRKDASDSDIKKAYRRLAKKHHPDSNKQNPNAEQIFKEITESYNVLSDEKKRALYDRFGHAAFDGSMGNDPEEFARQREAFTYSRQPFSDPFDLFGDLFGHAASEMTCDITISFREAALGCEKLISVYDPQPATMNVKIPAGISENTVLKLNRNSSTINGRYSGSIMLRVHVEEDPQFSRKDNDIYTRARIPYTLAALGGETKFQTLYGPVSCKIPAGSQSGRKIRLKGKGIVSSTNHNTYGDEYVILEITVPKKLSDREKRLLQELQEIEKIYRP